MQLSELQRGRHAKVIQALKEHGPLLLLEASKAAEVYPAWASRVYAPALIEALAIELGAPMRRFDAQGIVVIYLEGQDPQPRWRGHMELVSASQRGRRAGEGRQAYSRWSIGDKVPDRPTLRSRTLEAIEARPSSAQDLARQLRSNTDQIWSVLETLCAEELVTARAGLFYRDPEVIPRPGPRRGQICWEVVGTTRPPRLFDDFQQAQRYWSHAHKEAA